MTDLEIITAIQTESREDKGGREAPVLTDEIKDIAEKKRMTFDEPPFFRKQDPLR